MNRPVPGTPVWYRNHDRARTGIALVFMCLALALHSESVAHRFVSAEKNALIENILYLACGTSLSGMGFSSTRDERTAKFVLVAEYEQRAENIAIVYTLLDANRQPVSRQTLVTALDHRIDVVISEALHLLFEQAKTQGGNADSAGITDLFSWRQDASGPIPKNARSAPAFIFESGIEITGIIFFGDMAEYLSFGAGGALLAGATWRRNSWRVTAGVKAGFIRAFKNDDVTGPDMYISTGGILLMYGTGARSLYRITGSLSAGAAIITLADGNTVLNRTVPYADVGIAALLPAGKYFYYGAKLSFLTVFDPDSILTGAGISILGELEL